MLQEFVGESGGWLEGDVIKTVDKERLLVSEAMTKSAKGSAGDMTVSYSSAKRYPESGMIKYVIIEGLEVKNAAGKTAASMPGDEKTLLIRVLSGGEGA